MGTREGTSDNLLDESMSEDERQRAKKYTSKSKGTFGLTVENVEKMKRSVTSPSYFFRNLDWNILIMKKSNKTSSKRKKSLSFFLQCNGESDLSWININCCYARAELILLPGKEGQKSFIRKIEHSFCEKEHDWGFTHFIDWEDLLDPDKGYVSSNGSISVEVNLSAEMPYFTPLYSIKECKECKESMECIANKPTISTNRPKFCKKLVLNESEDTESENEESKTEVEEDNSENEDDNSETECEEIESSETEDEDTDVEKDTETEDNEKDSEDEEVDSEVEEEGKANKKEKRGGKAKSEEKEKEAKKILGTVCKEEKKAVSMKNSNEKIMMTMLVKILQLVNAHTNVFELSLGQEELKKEDILTRLISIEELLREMRDDRKKEETKRKKILKVFKKWKEEEEKRAKSEAKILSLIESLINYLSE